DVTEPPGRQLGAVGVGAGPARGGECPGPFPPRTMDEGEQVPTETARLRGDDTLGGDDGEGGVDGVAAGLEDRASGRGRQTVWGRDCPSAHSVLRSGRKRLRASSTERTAARVSSSST